MSALHTTLERNRRALQERIGRAMERGRRLAGSVRLVAVTKSVRPHVATALCELGQRDLGESRVDALLEKQEALASLPGVGEVRWHMIGHLQRNKARRFLGSGALLHSLDSERLTDILEREIEKGGRPPGDGPLRVLVEVNVAREPQKNGCAPEELAGLLERVRRQGRLEAAGLMCMAPEADDPETARPVFRALRELRDRNREKSPELVELSMGMSGDFEVAVEEGATLVRVGAALFGGLALEDLAPRVRPEAQHSERLPQMKRGPQAADGGA